MWNTALSWLARKPLAWRIALVLVVGATLLMPALGAHVVIHDDEGRYVGATLEALEAGDLVTPLREGQFNRAYGKPPLAHGLMAVSVSVFGANKAAFRLPFVLGGLLLLVTLLLTGESLHRNTGLAAALVLLTSAGWAEHTRRIWLESLYIPFDLLAIYLYARDRTRARLWTLLATGALCAASLLTKQLAGGFALATIVIVELISPGIRWRRLLAIAGLALAPLALWAGLLVERVGSEATSVWSFHVVRGVVHGHAHQARWAGDYIKGLVELLGWAGAVLGALSIGKLLGDTWRHDSPFALHARLIARACLVYAALNIVVIALVSRSNRYWYAFPGAVILALGAGYVIARALDAFEPHRDWPWLIAALTGFVSVQSNRIVSEGYVLAVGLAWLLLLAAVQRWGRGQWAQNVPRIASGAALAAAVLAGAFVSWYANIQNVPQDPLEKMAGSMRAAAVDSVIVEPTFVRHEYLFYLSGLELERVAKGGTCRAAQPGRRSARLALGRNRPQCWSRLPGNKGRFQNVHWLLPPPALDRAPAAGPAAPASEPTLDQ